MSHTTFSVDKTPALIPFAAMVAGLVALDVPFQRKGVEIALKDPGHVLTGEFLASVREHKAQLLALADCRYGFTRLCEYAVRLRCENPPRGTRAQAIAYQEKQIEKLAAISANFGGTEGGWPDPADVFADGDQLLILRLDLDEVRAGPYPARLPEGCHLVPCANFNPFEHGRLYSGRVIAEGLS